MPQKRAHIETIKGVYNSLCGKSQNTPQLAVGMNGKWGLGGESPQTGLFPLKNPAACCGVLHSIFLTIGRLLYFFGAGDRQDEDGG